MVWDRELTSMIAMKVHHEGFLESQTVQLRGKTGLPNVESAVSLSEMAMANGDESLINPATA